MQPGDGWATARRARAVEVVVSMSEIETRCRQCGDVFEQAGRGRPRVYCERCRPPAPPVDAETRRVNAERKQHPQLCAHCGREFVGRLRKYPGLLGDDREAGGARLRGL